MQNFEQIGRELQRRGKTEQIRQLAESEDGAKLARLVDANAVEQAARSGDGEALKAILSSVLNTREGRRLAEDVRKMMED
ncbi:MAG: hypothetical protein SO014_05865 [Candidatus Limivicinus sp.]|nr:hypothetical protein [Clostridiales bacterium]MDY3860143.1 hypothetical protein [Candidatus Limivicinus sp.]